MSGSAKQKSGCAGAAPLPTLVEALPNFAPQVGEILRQLCLHESAGVRPESLTADRIESAPGPGLFMSIVEDQVDFTAAHHFEDECEKFLSRLAVTGWKLESGLPFDQQAVQARALWDEIRKPGRNRLLKTLYRFAVIRGIYAKTPLLPPLPTAGMQEVDRLINVEVARLFAAAARDVNPMFMAWQSRTVEVEMVTNPGGRLPGLIVGRFIGEAMRLLLSLPYPQILQHGSDLSWIGNFPALVVPGEPEVESVETTKGLKKIRAFNQDYFLTRLSMVFEGKPWSLVAVLSAEDFETAAHWLLDEDGLIVHAFAKDPFADWGDKNEMRFAEAKIVDVLTLGRQDLRERLSNLIVNTKRWWRNSEDERIKEQARYEQADEAAPPVCAWDGRPYPLRLATQPKLGPKLVNQAAKAIKTGVEASAEAVSQFLGPCAMPLDLGRNSHLMNALVAAHCDMSDYILFRLEGGQMFQMPEVLARAVTESGMEDIPMSAIHLPHDSFYLDLGMSLSIAAETQNGDPVELGIEGFYLRKDLSPSGSQAIVITPVLDYETRLQELTCSRVWIPFGEGTLEEQIHIGSQEIWEGLQKKRRAVESLAQRNPLHQAIASQTDIIEKMERVDGDRQVLADPVLCTFIGRAVACILCFLTEYQDSAVSTLLGDKSRLPEQAAQDPDGPQLPQTPIDWWRFGVGHVKVFRDPFKAIEDSGDGTGTGRKLVAHLRKGFFRMQPYGPKNSLRRSKWINPYLVNADDPRDVKQKIYEV